MVTPLNVETIEAASDGLDTESSPDEVTRRKAPVHRNFLVHRPGQMPMRGPLANHTALAVGADETLSGAWVFNDKALVGVVDKSASAVREPWSVPHRKASTAAVLAEPETTMKLIDFSALTVSNVVGTQDTVIAGRGARLENRVYGHAYSSGTDVNENGGFQHRRGLMVWTGSTSAPTILTNAPDGGQAVAVHYNRLFVLGGRDVPGGGTTIEPNSLFFSDFGGPTADTAAKWQSDTSGLTNKIVVGTDDGNDYGVGLCSIGDALVIFKRNSFYVLSGYDEATFNLRVVSSSIGCVDQRSIVASEIGCFFMSHEGYMFFDGSQVRAVSDPVRTDLAARVHSTVGLGGVDGGRIVAERLPNDYIIISALQQTILTGAPDAAAVCYLYHIPTGNWTNFTSEAAADSIPSYFVRTSNYVALFDGDHFAKCETLTLPESAAEAARGFDEVNANKAAIPALWQSKITRASTVPFMSQLHRLLIDYHFALDAGADDSASGWYVRLIQGNGDSLLTEYQVPTMGDPSNYLFRRRSVKDVFSEVSDCQLQVEWRSSTNPPPAVKSAILYDCFLEFQSGRQRRST